VGFDGNTGEGASNTAQSLANLEPASAPGPSSLVTANTSVEALTSFYKAESRGLIRPTTTTARPTPARPGGLIHDHSRHDKKRNYLLQGELCDIPIIATDIVYEVPPW
jgi:hypothetical protein